MKNFSYYRGWYSVIIGKKIKILGKMCADDVVIRLMA